jgi:hypothetical protein
LQLRISNAEYLGVRKVWADGKKQRLENLLGSFLRGLAVAAEAKKAERVQRAESERQRLEEAHRRAELEQQRWEEERRARELERQMGRWLTARQIREYVGAMKQASAVQLPEEFGFENVEDLAAWASRYADRLDPLKRA